MWSNNCKQELIHIFFFFKIRSNFHRTKCNSTTLTNMPNYKQFFPPIYLICALKPSG
jgi:hypothetical protein